MNSQPPARWEKVWLADAVRLAEDTGPMDDAQILARLQGLPASEHDKLLERAWLLAKRLGWVTQLERMRDAGWLLLLLVAGAVVALANGLLFSVLAEGRSINAASGFVSALGFHGVSLVFWLLSIPLARRQRSSGSAGLSMGRWMTRIVARLPAWRGPQTAALVQAGTRLVGRERLSPWAFGLISHLVWTFGFAFMLTGLLLAFAFREYQLTWETTILGPGWFASFARVTGYLPALLGVPVPHPGGAGGTLAQGVAHAGAWPAREAAAWLLACVTLYGLLPRALCAAWCAWVMRRAARRVELDLQDPYYQQLLARLQALESAEVTDAEHLGPLRSDAERVANGASHAGFAAVGFELAGDGAWLSASLQAAAVLAVRIAGTMPEQLQLQTTLARLQPERLLIVCDAQASPDRGTLRFLREASTCAAQCALAFAVPGVAAGHEHDAERRRVGLARWKSWMNERDLQDWKVFDSTDAAQPWALEAA